MKVSELEGDLLDRWVARAEGLKPQQYDTEYFKGWYVPTPPIEPQAVPMYSRRWAVGGPIIERANIAIARDEVGEHAWEGIICGRIYACVQDGPTPLIAAMRAYVTSKFGEEVAAE